MSRERGRRGGSDNTLKTNHLKVLDNSEFHPVHWPSVAVDTSSSHPGKAESPGGSVQTQVELPQRTTEVGVVHLIDATLRKRSGWALYFAVPDGVWNISLLKSTCKGHVYRKSAIIFNKDKKPTNPIDQSEVECSCSRPTNNGDQPSTSGETKWSVSPESNLEDKKRHLISVSE